ncbi:MAG: VWA domain-containing protein [Paracoccaceae bacterium]|jgi:uncharacterized protein with von Willebrand factor type A (vWA) domain|nr:VWA domain-containing protein [Paracoccaceae bacterium]
MSRVSRFTAADPGPAARVSGFIAHLRDNGFSLGVAETDTALRALSVVNPIDPNEARGALKAVCAGTAEEAGRFDMLFDAFWMAEGRVRHKVMPSARNSAPAQGRSSRTDESRNSGGEGTIHAPENAGDGAESYAEHSGKLLASKTHTLMKKDLRELVSSDDIRAAEKVATALGKALRDRRSRRRKASLRGSAIDLRRTIRHSLATGGEPLRLSRRRRPDRPMRLAALCDVSGSMMTYARPFLAFLAGLMRADGTSDAYLFHTRLVRITDPLRDPDPLRALNRITLLADGFGGGSKIASNLQHFANSYARRFVDGRTVVLILSDGYDSEAPEILAAALEKLRKRGCRIVWLNPLKGWKDYAPIAKGMAAALPYLDEFAAATTLADLAALDQKLGRL